MDDISEGLASNMATYERDMDRIIRKYSQHQDNVNNVICDLNETSSKVCQRHILKAEGQLKMSLRNTSSLDFGEESLRAQDTSDTRQWDNTLQEGEADETDRGGNHSVQHEVTGVSGMNHTQLSRSFSDETRGSQPEDRDEELEKTLSSHGTSLVELYPRMIDQLSKAVYSQQVFDAADSVLRKYRRQRFQPNASRLLDHTLDVSVRAPGLNHTLHVSVRAPDLRNPKKKHKGKVNRKRSPNRSLLVNLTPGKTREVVNQSYLHGVANQQDQQTEIGGRKKKKADPVESKYRPDVLIHPSFVTKILQRQQHLAPTESPRHSDQPTGRSGRLTIDGFRSQSPRSGREVIHPLPTCNAAAHETESFTVTDSSAVFSSPVRRSPFKTWLKNVERQSGMSPHAPLSQRPKSDTAGSPSRHLVESRSNSPCPLSSPQKSIMSPTKHHHYYSPSQPKVNVCQSPSRIHELHTAQSHCRHPASPSRHLGESGSRSASPAASPQKHPKHLWESTSASLLSFTVADSSAVSSSPVRQRQRQQHLAPTEHRSQSPRPGREVIHPLPTCNAAAHEKESFTVTDAAVFSSPVRQSPFKTWLRNVERQSGMSTLGESRSRSASPLSSPQKSIVSPTKHRCYYSPSQPKVNVCQSPSRIHESHTAQRQSHCGHPAFARSRSETPHSSLQQSTMSPRKHHHCSDSPSSSQPKIYSRQSTTGTGRSLDISTCHDDDDSSTSSIRYSPKKIDMEFQRVYHGCVCLGKPVPLGPLCSVCTMHRDANRAISALALSPHRSLLRKRHRELDSENAHSSKRFRGHCDVVNSPGSHRHLKKACLKPSSSRRLYSTGPEASTDFHTDSDTD